MQVALFMLPYAPVSDLPSDGIVGTASMDMAADAEENPDARSKWAANACRSHSISRR